ncbi:MAG: TetR/AcrR family transcriptional regulator [Polyangiales bacterium]
MSGTEENRNRLVDAAAEALVAGDGAFEVQEVATRAGLSVGLTYHRFGSKAGLIAAVVDRMYDQLLQAIDIPHWPTHDWGGRERERTRRFIDFVYENPVAAIVFSKLASEPEVVGVATERWNGVVQDGARNIAQGQRRGVLPRTTDPSRLSALINGAVRHAVAQALAADPRPERDQLTDEVWSFIEAGLRIGPDPRAITTQALPES